MKEILSNYLDYRKEDKLYQKYSKLLIDYKLESAIISELRSKYWKEIFNMGYLKDYYIEGATLTDFITNIMRTIGGDNVKNGVKLYNKALDRFVEYMKNIYSKDISFSDDDIRRYTYYRMFYKVYTGFLFEEILVNFLKDEGFEVIQNKSLDDDYKIDILIKKEDKVIGIQCKSITYTKVKPYIRKYYEEHQRKAIDEGVADKVIFILYDDKFNVYSEGGSPLNYERLIRYIMCDNRDKYLEIKKYLLKSPNKISI